MKGLDRRVAHGAPEDPLGANAAHERARVDPRDRDGVLLPEPPCELRARVVHHDGLALHPGRLHPRVVHAVGPDERVAKHRTCAT